MDLVPDVLCHAGCILQAGDELGSTRDRLLPAKRGDELYQRQHAKKIVSKKERVSRGSRDELPDRRMGHAFVSVKSWFMVLLILPALLGCCKVVY
jgi:hypothetical protein